ncbi:plant UBX domain-containing protein 1-like isoform X4 [Prosopis cineraria]|uniref:plant UBX domain-containing protein 1-like isoform X4 n=1 Tax=Prosopis cineraria TaxID=364024 RepID=UPI002410B422|nr:plant UBX domain-containing protein 1-like isoform X4 [Prosopis cineraria]
MLKQLRPSLQLSRKGLDERSVYSKHLQFLQHQMLQLTMRLMISMSSPLKIIINCWLLKRKFCADKFLKTRKIREAEEAARRSRMTKAVIRVRFPDNHTLEATFHPSETLQSLVDLLTKVIAQPEQPFCIYTTPPRKLIKDMSQDFYAAGFCPGAIVYFSHNTPLGESSMAEHTGPFLLEDVVSLKGLDVTNDHGQQSEPVQSAPEPVEASQTPAVQERKPADKKLVKPKWLKM